MYIYYNDKKIEIEGGTTVLGFLEGQGVPLTGVAVAIADEVVPKELWATTVLAEGVNLLVIRAFSGG
jgi:sulfur carrier protein